jgi:hypothetical protein
MLGTARCGCCQHSWQHLILQIALLLLVLLPLVHTPAQLSPAAALAVTSPKAAAVLAH